MSIALSACELRQLLSYSPETGVLTWAERASNRIHIGDAAGAIDRGGYIVVRIRGHLYRAHRLIWLHVTGAWPAEHIDHINGDTGDNRWSNLRAVSNTINAQNKRRAPITSKTGVLGANPWGKTGRFVARIHVNGFRMKLGVFDSLDEAHAAYIAAKRKFHPGCTL